MRKRIYRPKSGLLYLTTRRSLKRQGARSAGLSPAKRIKCWKPVMRYTARSDPLLRRTLSYKNRSAVRPIRGTDPECVSALVSSCRLRVQERIQKEKGRCICVSASYGCMATPTRRRRPRMTSGHSFSVPRSTACSEDEEKRHRHGEYIGVGDPFYANRERNDTST
jgi:hypothetical protein